MEEKSTKKSLKWLWIVIALVVVAGIAVWCAISASNANGLTDIFGINLLKIEKFRKNIDNL